MDTPERLICESHLTNEKGKYFFQICANIQFLKLLSTCMEALIPTANFCDTVWLKGLLLKLSDLFHCKRMVGLIESMLPDPLLSCPSQRTSEQKTAPQEWPPSRFSPGPIHFQPVHQRCTDDGEPQIYVRRRHGYCLRHQPLRMQRIT